jgi:hypothetical protein
MSILDDGSVGGSHRLEIKVRDWETRELPARPRLRAVWRLVPPPGVVAFVAADVYAVVTDSRWLMIAVAVFAILSALYMHADEAIRVGCETADHWVGGGEMPHGMTEACPYCRHIPFRELWAAGRSGRHSRFRRFRARRQQLGRKGGAR